MTTDPVRLGIVGCGDVSRRYFRGTKMYRSLEVVCCADIDLERAKMAGDTYGVPVAASVDRLLADHDIEVVVNLTPPSLHRAISLAAISADKHVYSEKPLGISLEEAQEVIAAADANGLRVACSPDTFLLARLQACRKVLDDGWIGRPIAATAFCLTPGGEHSHPDPEFFYRRGAGPMLDIGPYYVTTLVALLGSIARVTGAARRLKPERVVGSGERAGEIIHAETPTHSAAILEFASGVLATLAISFDVLASTVPHIEIYGTEGTLLVPDPDEAAGPPKVARGAGLHGASSPEWSDVPLPYVDDVGDEPGVANRGVGLADLASALRSGRPHRASATLAYHVLEALLAVEQTSDAGMTGTSLSSTCGRPAPLSADRLV